MKHFLITIFIALPLITSGCLYSKLKTKMGFKSKPQKMERPEKPRPPLGEGLYPTPKPEEKKPIIRGPQFDENGNYIPVEK